MIEDLVRDGVRKIDEMVPPPPSWYSKSKPKYISR